jgi:hypothetical protein
MFKKIKFLIKYAEFGRLVIDTIKYFHDEGLARGLFTAAPVEETK